MGFKTKEVLWLCKELNTYMNTNMKLCSSMAKSICFSKGKVLKNLSTLCEKIH